MIVIHYLSRMFVRPPGFTGIVIDEQLDIYHYQNGLRHNPYGTAGTYSNICIYTLDGLPIADRTDNNLRKKQLKYIRANYEVKTVE